MGRLINKKVEDIMDLIYGKSLPQKNRINGNIPVFGSNGIIDYHNEKLFSGPGIIIGRKGTVGSIKYSDSDFWAIDTTYVIKLIDKNYNLKYWYYFLQTQNLDKMNSHSAVPGLNRSAVYSKNITFHEDIEEQEAIAHVLSTLDEKIEVNNRINEILENMAQELFNRWFVDFEFPNENGEPYKSSGGEMVDSELGPIPKDWYVSNLDEVANYINGLAMQKYKPNLNEKYLKVMKIKELRQGFCDENSDICSELIDEKYIVDNGDVIFSWSGSLMVDIWCNGKVGLNQHLFKVISEKYPKWFYLLWTKKHLEKFIGIAKDKATTMGHIKRQELKKSYVIIADNEQMISFSKIFSPIYEKIIKNKIEINSLIKMRDLLLPKLISGEIRLKELENNE